MLIGCIYIAKSISSEGKNLYIQKINPQGFERFAMLKMFVNFLANFLSSNVNQRLSSKLLILCASSFPRSFCYMQMILLEIHTMAYPKIPLNVTPAHLLRTPQHPYPSQILLRLTDCFRFHLYRFRFFRCCGFRVFWYVGFSMRNI